MSCLSPSTSSLPTCGGVAASGAYFRAVWNLVSSLSSGLMINALASVASCPPPRIVNADSLIDNDAAPTVSQLDRRLKIRSLSLFGTVYSSEQILSGRCMRIKQWKTDF